jgi:NAD(P)-dependent dehydrogenase (short-subunit alcohol dehydrogenase family)
MTRVLSAALAPHDINVNCVCPGGVATDMLREVAFAYGNLAGQPAGDVFPQLISSQLVRHIESLAYSASKAALINMTRVLSAALAPHDINVNCVCPGGVATDMLREVAFAYGKLAGQSVGDVFPQLISSQLVRHIEPIEVSRTISFLLSDDAIIIRGQAVSADGGDTPY